MSNHKTGEWMDCTIAAKPASKKARHPYATVTAVFYVDGDYPDRAVADRIVNAPVLLDAAEARLAAVEAERDRLREALAAQEAIVADLAQELATVEMVLDDPDNACVEEGEVAERVMKLRASATVALCPACGETTTCDEDRCCPCGRDLLVFADRYSAELYQEGQQEHADRLATIHMRIAEVNEVLCSNADDRALRAVVAGLCSFAQQEG